MSPDESWPSAPVRAMPSATRRASFFAWWPAIGASVATTTMIEPAGLPRSRSWPICLPTGTPRMVHSGRRPKFDWTKTPTVQVSPAAFTRREEVPEPPLKS